VADQAPRVLLAALAVACAVAGVGCGSDSEKATKTSETEARGVVERFGTATARRDYQTICDELLADNLVKKVEDVGLPCEIAFEKGVGGVKNPRIEVRQVKVQGNRALVSVRSTATGETPSDDAVQLVREGDEWRIASLVSPSRQGKEASTTAATT
jgi:Putative lumazine-binding